MATKKATKKAAAKKQVKTTKVAILGLGTVGRSVAELLLDRKFPGIEITHVYNRSIGRKQNSAIGRRLAPTVVWTEKIEDVLNSNADVILELIGGLNPIEGWLKKALSSGKSVVTANKQLIAYRGLALERIAEAKGVSLLYNAAVAGGVPVIPGVNQGVSGDEIVKLSGIVNGTCNFILSHMEQGAEYADVLAQAQELGYAEANPSADVDGFDARAKLCILSRVAMRVDINPDAIPTQSISEVSAIDFAYAKELGCTIRQVSRAQLTGKVVHARVAPMLVPMASPIAWSRGTQNMVVTSGRFGGDVVFSGHGAGGHPTAVAVVSDLLAVTQKSGPVKLSVKRREVVGEFLAPHYLRFVVSDKPGIVSAISGALAKVGANIDSILQRPGYPKNRLPFVVTTEPCLTSVVEKAVRSIAKMDCMLEQPLCLQMLRVEDKAED